MGGGTILGKTGRIAFGKGKLAPYNKTKAQLKLSTEQIITIHHQSFNYPDYLRKPPLSDLRSSHLSTLALPSKPNQRFAVPRLAFLAAWPTVLTTILLLCLIISPIYPID